MQSNSFEKSHRTRHSKNSNAYPLLFAQEGRLSLLWNFAILSWKFLYEYETERVLQKRDVLFKKMDRMSCLRRWTELCCETVLANKQGFMGHAFNWTQHGIKQVFLLFCVLSLLRQHSYLQIFSICYWRKELHKTVIVINFIWYSRFHCSCLFKGHGCMVWVELFLGILFIVILSQAGRWL